jgi:hypothetical protein
MDSDLSTFVTEIWQHQPIIIVLLIAGFVIFVLLVIDTYRHRKKLKGRQKRLH